MISPWHLHTSIPPMSFTEISRVTTFLTGFGKSKIVDVNPHMTHSWITQCPGTPAFMPSEALQSKTHYSEKLDIFSMGVLIIQIITRKFAAPTDGRKAKTAANN